MTTQTQNSNRCMICGNKTLAVNTITEPRYFHGEGKVCGPCFMYWASGNYHELDKLAIEKIKEKLQ